MKSLESAIDAARREEQCIVKNLGKDSASAALPEGHGWNRPRQALGRALSAIAHADRMPPPEANWTYAQLMQATSLLMETPLKRALSNADIHTLHALLSTGEHGNRWTAHSGMPSQQMVPLVYRSEKMYTAAVINFRQGIGSKRLEVTPRAFGDSAALIAHESVHEAQVNSSHPRDSARYRSRQALHSTARHPRGGMLEAARGLPFSGYAEVTARSGQGQRVYLESHALSPVEVQAFTEQAAAQLLLPLQHATLKMEPFPAACGIDQLVSVLVRAGWQLNEADGAQPRPSAAERAQGEPPTARYDPAKNPQAAAFVEQILFRTAELHAAVHSSAWTPGAQQALKDSLAALVRKSQRPQLHGVQLLEEIANTLARFLDTLQQEAPYALQTPAAGPRLAAQQPFNVSKADPAAVLHHVMAQKDGRKEGDIQPVPRTSAEQMARAFHAAKTESGFQAGVQAFIDSGGRLPEPAAVVDTVTRLAARLMGLDVAQLPFDLRPAINLYEAPSIELERVAGLNAPPAAEPLPADAAFSPVTSHQKRKAVFDPVAWQLHVPQHFFHPSQADRLPARLAGLAADMAYTAVAALAHNNPAGWRTNDSLSAAGLWGAQMPALSSPALHALGQSPAWEEQRHHHDHAQAASVDLLPTAAQGFEHRVLLPVTNATPSPADALNRLCTAYIAAQPDSAAAVLRAVVKATPVKDLGLLWHLGPRAEVKHAAQNGEPGALAAYEASSLQRWMLPAVAFRRAVMHESKSAKAS